MWFNDINTMSMSHTYCHFPCQASSYTFRISTVLLQCPCPIPPPSKSLHLFSSSRILPLKGIFNQVSWCKWGLMFIWRPPWTLVVRTDQSLRAISCLLANNCFSPEKPPAPFLAIGNMINTYPSSPPQCKDLKYRDEGPAQVVRFGPQTTGLGVRGVSMSTWEAV